MNIFFHTSALRIHRLSAPELLLGEGVLFVDVHVEFFLSETSSTKRLEYTSTTVTRRRTRTDERQYLT